jgi:hypothetical protein
MPGGDADHAWCHAEALQKLRTAMRILDSTQAERAVTRIRHELAECLPPCCLEPNWPSVELPTCDDLPEMPGETLL